MATGERPPSDSAEREEPDEFGPDRVLFQGGGLLAIDKPAGIPVDEGTGHDRGIADIVAEWGRCHPGVLDLKVGKRPLPVQHHDLETTGVLLLATRRAMARRLQAAFSAGEIERRYVAVVAGPLAAEGEIRGKLRTRVGHRYERRDAALSYHTIASDERLSLVEANVRDGGRHLVRALFAQQGHPLGGDRRYGKPRPAEQFLERFGVPHFLLHCTEVVLPADILGGERTIRAPLPGMFERVALEKGWSDAPKFVRLATQK